MHTKTNDVTVNCNFSLYPMTDNFVKIILDALANTDTSHLESYTDALSTTYSGNLFEVIKTLQQLFINAYRPTIHMAMEGRIVNEKVGDNSITINYKDLVTKENIPVLCKFSLYEISHGSMLSHLYEIAQKDSLEFSNQNDVFYLEGDINKVFSFLNQVYMSINNEVNTCILHFTISVNSPTK